MSASSWWSLPWRWLADAPTLDQAIQDDFTAVEAVINELRGGAAGWWLQNGTATIAAGTWAPAVLVEQTTPTRPTPGAFTLSGDGKTVTVNSAGWYVIGGWLQVHANTGTTTIYSRIYNMSLSRDYGQAGGSPQDHIRGSVGMPAYLTAGTPLQLQGYASVAGYCLNGRFSLLRVR